MADEVVNRPRHVAIIMDGNGRWAGQRGLSRSEGHRAGAESVRRVVEACHDLGIAYLTLYAFSTENWRRPAREVQALMTLLRQFLDERHGDLVKYGIRLQAIGELSRLNARLRRRLDEVMEETAGNTKGTLTLALSYGGRTEIVHAARAIAKRVRDGDLRLEDIDEAAFESELYTAGLPDPDLIIRTANEHRLSNFLLWQASYAEFWSTAVCWPDFSKDTFMEALSDFARRKRRFGEVNNA